MSFIYTLGTSNNTKEECLGLLREYKIEAVIDVRSFPRSKFEHFTGENLERTLKKEGIRYIYLGKELGGFRKDGYTAYTKTSSYSAGILSLENIARENTSAIICAERFPWKCHRRFIASTLEERGWKVRHILFQGRVWTPKKTRKTESFVSF